MPFVPDDNTQAQAKPTPGFVGDDEAPSKGFGVADALKAMSDRNLNVGSGAIQGATLGNVKAPELPGVEKDPTAQTFGKGLGALIPAMAGGALASASMPLTTAGKAMPGIMGAVGRTAVNTGVGALQGGLQAPQEGETRTGNAIQGGKFAGILSGAGEAIGGIGRKVADHLMRRAVGMRKYIPGVGNTLTDEGLVGTHGMLEGQASRGFDRAEGELQDLVKGNTTKTPSTDIANAVAERGNKFKLPSTGEVPENMQPYAQKVRETSEGLSKMGGGQLSPEDLLATKRQGDWVGYTNSGNKATSLEAELGQAQGDASREALRKVTGGKANEVLGREKALLLAKKALEKPETMHQGIGSSLFFGKLPGTSILGSLGAQASQKGLGSLGDLMSNPKILQALLANASQDDSK